jgi:hypothetical protein
MQDAQGDRLDAQECDLQSGRKQGPDRYLPGALQPDEHQDGVFCEFHDSDILFRKVPPIYAHTYRMHIQVNGPWPYKLSAIYYTAEVTAAVKKLEQEQRLKAA